MATGGVELSKYEEYLFDQVRKGFWDEFSEYFFGLPLSGTRYTNEDRVEEYAVLHSLWGRAGRPEEELKLVGAEGQPITYLVEWDSYYGGDPVFLLPHGYLFLPWAKRVITSGKEIVVAEGGTGSAKTSSAGVSAIIQCAVWPGIDILNVAPTVRQATDMMDDQFKWLYNSKFARFIVRTPKGDLIRQKPYPTITVQVYEHHSTFICMTVGRDFDFGLGDEFDAIRVDEAGLMYNVDTAVPRLATRIRGTRRDGRPRGILPFLWFSSNPHFGNIGYDELKARARRLSKQPNSKWQWENPEMEENKYITRRQIDFQEELLDDTQRRRWHKGQDDVFDTMGAIPITNIERCRSDSLEGLLAQIEELGGPFEERDRVGVVHYEIPPVEGHEYIVFGDPGTANVSLTGNNIPVVGVLDITAFPEGPAQFVAYRMIDGGGKYKPWITEMQRLLLKYRAFGCFDATGTGRAFSEWPELEPFHMHQVSLSGGNKGTAKTMFVLLAGEGLFAWPFIKSLWHQASAYRESGPGIHKIPDDVLAALFVASFYLRIRFYEKLSARFDWEKLGLAPKKDPKEEEKISRSRYIGRRGGRYGRATRSVAKSSRLDRE
jgi:hypothetical protein